MSAFNIRLQVGVVIFKYKTKQFSHDVNNIMSVRRFVFCFSVKFNLYAHFVSYKQITILT